MTYRITNECSSASESAQSFLISTLVPLLRRSCPSTATSSPSLSPEPMTLLPSIVRVALTGRTSAFDHRVSYDFFGPTDRAQTGGTMSRRGGRLRRRASPDRNAQSGDHPDDQMHARRLP